jgi:hypothetical protein
VFESLIGSLIAAFLLLSFVLLLGHVENLVVLEFLASVGDRQENGLSGGLQELTFLELELTLELLSLDIGDEEGRNEILNQDLRLVLLSFDLVKEFVDSLDLEFGFIVCL